jgi:hypothetical protein
MRAMRTFVVIPMVAALAACATVRKPAPQAVPKVPAGNAAAETQALRTSDLVGRWVFAPGDSNVPEPAAEPESGKDSEATAASADAPPSGVVSPAGAVLTLGEGGVMLAREGDFVRRGIWKFDGRSLRIIVEPPPRRIEMGLIPELAGDRLTLTGVEELLLVYHRDHFIAPRSSP